MAIEMRSLSELDPDLVSQSLAEAVTRIQEDNPTLDLRAGVFFGLLTYYHALLGAQRQTNINDYLNGRSLAAIEADPALADPDLVNDILSNFRVDRKPGEQAGGRVIVVVNDDVTVVIGVGAVFEANGKRFVTEQVYTAKLETSQIVTSGDRLLSRLSDGNWGFSIDVIAEEEGAVEVKKDSLVLPVSKPTGYVTSYAASDFTGGLTAETNQDLLGRLQLGAACKSMSNRTTMQAMLREIEAFSRIVSMSIVGLGDAEMLRDQHTIWPMSLGGRADWYVRSQEQVLRLRLTKSATMVGLSANGSIWQTAIGRDDAPGFYEFGNVRLPSSENVVSGYEIISETRANDMTGSGVLPDVVSVTEGAYSRFQTAVIQFEDTTTNPVGLSVGDKQDYEIEAKCMPLIGDIQDTLMHRNTRHHGADVLVKAPVPCFVQLHFTIYKATSDGTIATDDIKIALAHTVNGVGFVGKLYGSALYDVIHSYLQNDINVSALDMHGRIRYPDGSIEYLRSNEVLTVPDDPANMVSSRTVQFFIDPEDITIVVQSNVPSDP